MCQIFFREWPKTETMQKFRCNTIISAPFVSDGELVDTLTFCLNIYGTFQIVIWQSINLNIFLKAITDTSHQLSVRTVSTKRMISVLNHNNIESNNYITINQLSNNTYLLLLLESVTFILLLIIK